MPCGTSWTHLCSAHTSTPVAVHTQHRQRVRQGIFFIHLNMCLRSGGLNKPVNTLSTHNISQLLLHFLRSQFLAEWRLPEQHITVVGQQLWALGLWLCFRSHSVDHRREEFKPCGDCHWPNFPRDSFRGFPIKLQQTGTYPLFLEGNSSLNIEVSFTTNL